MVGQPRDAIKCLTKDEIIKTVGQEGIVLNSDGTVSVFYLNPKMGLYPVQLTLECCKVLDPNYYFDINTQTCRWTKPQDTCGFSKPINLIVNPKGDDGTLFFVDDFEKETCDLKISFDYLLKIKCEDLLNITNPTVTTNIQSQETIDQIVRTEMAISEINVKIETLTSEVVVLNQQYINTPYSIHCDQFPVPGCVRPATTIINLFVNINGVNFQNNADACNALGRLVNGQLNGQALLFEYVEVTNLAVNGTVYVHNLSNDCTLYRDGWYVVSNGVNKVIHIVNGIIVYLGSCTIPCVRPTNLAVTFYESNHGIVNRTTPNEACALWTTLQTPNNIYAGDTGSPVQTTSFAIGSRVYQGYNTTGCAGLADGYHVIIGRGVIHITNNIIDGIYTSCPITAPFAPSSTGPSSKIAAFDNSGFSTDLTDTSAYQKGSTTTYITVNYCLTDLGLQTWQTILGPTRYQQFILGDPNSYTCADVIALTQQSNASQLFYSCDVPFGTKSQLLVQINQHMAQITELNNLLNEYETILIKLQNSFETTITGTKGCQTSIEALESLDVEMHLDVVNDDNTLTSVFTYPIFPAINSTTNLYNYLTNNPSSGFYICGDPSKDNPDLSNCTTLSLDGNIQPNVDSCNSIVDDLVNGLIKESGNPSNTIPYNAFASPWLTYTHVISNVTNPDIIAAITNKKIKISFRIKFSCVDFCLLLDNLVLDKTCKSVDRHDITISQNPGFDLKRVIDNKKSWIDTTTPTNREFLIAKNNGNNPIRQTDYNVNDERLVINSKEIDLDISIASAIETDVWCYLNDNPCLLTGCTETVLPYEDPYSNQIRYFPTNETNNGGSCLTNNSTLIDYFNISGVLSDISECYTILRFVDTSSEFIYDNYYLTKDSYNNLGFYYYAYLQEISNNSKVYRTKECCESLNSVLEVVNVSLPDGEKLKVYWDNQCKTCKFLSDKCGDDKIDFHSLVTQPISGVTTIEQFENLMTSEFIDAKNRQTISSYPTLRAVYDRYLHSSDYCGTVSSAFDYQNMDKFAGLIGSYWVDLIEQVVPSTTIWGSVKIYTNTIFDEQKFKYKSYSSLLCNNPFQGQQVLSPINGVSGLCQSVNVIYSDLLGGKKLIIDNLITTNLVGEQIMALPKLGSATAENTNNTIFGSKPRINVCDNLCIAQMNSGSEFISYVQVNTLTCNFDGNLKYDTKTLTPITIGGTLPFSYLWSNGATTPTINTTTPGNYTVTVTDANKCSFTAQYEILGQKACWFTMPETPEYVMGSFYQDLYGICDLNDYPLKEVIFNVWEITINNQPITLPAPPLSTTMTPNTINWVAATNSLVYKCVPGQITGQTYTNYVDFLNSVFNSLGLTGYKAQVSLKAQKVGDTHYHDHNGFYILYPATDSFSIKTESVNNTDKYIYSNTGMFEWNPLYEGYNPWGGYGKSFCDGITVTNGKVIE
jgi:hypothetical protein